MPSKKRHFQKHNQQHQRHNVDEAEEQPHQDATKDHDDEHNNSAEQEEQQEEDKPKGRYEDIKTTGQIVEILIERFIPYSKDKKRFSFFWGLHPFEPSHDVTLTDEQVRIMHTRFFTLWPWRLFFR